MSRYNIPFHRPYFSGNELRYLEEAIKSEKLSGGGAFSRKCLDFFKNTYGMEDNFLTSSGTGALE
ncbi:MAG: dTDP-4-amino-4,6-dideoxygalactose transaminase, partial [Bacteroidota bacterium]